MRLKIAGGRLYDPSRNWRGEVRDLYLDGERIVPYLREVDEVWEARHLAVVPGGIDLRGQVATYGLNFLRLWDEMSSPLQVAEAYAALGYTQVHEPFLTLATAPYVHRQLAALPVVDTSASLVVNLRDLDLWLKDQSRLAEVAETLQFFAEQAGALNFRVVEPWVRHRQEIYAYRHLALEETLELLARLAEILARPFILEASPEVLRSRLPEPRLFHLAALGPALKDEELLEAALGHLEGGVSADLGLIRPRETPSADGVPVQVDLGLSRPVLLNPKPDYEAARRALRLALASDGRPVAFSGAGAVQGPVQAYPDFFRWLGNREARRQFLGEELGDRQWSFEDWLWATRTLPARLLGLEDRGHLGPGARADLAFFDLPPGPAAEARWPEFVGQCRTLLKGGVLVIQDYRLVTTDVPKTTWFRVTHAEKTHLAAEICQYRSLRPENLWVSPNLEGKNWRSV